MKIVPWVAMTVVAGVNPVWEQWSHLLCLILVLPLTNISRTYIELSWEMDTGLDPIHG
jgi:hypothetical protein